MDSYPHHAIPIRSKLEMLNDIAYIIRYLHDGARGKANPFMDDLKTRASFLEEKVQQDVLMFCQEVCFQYDYDPWHKITPEIQKAADKLIADLE